MNQNAIAALSGAVARVAAAHPESFAGFEIQGESLIVHSVPPDTAMRRAVRSVPNPHSVPIEFTPAANTLRELKAITAQLESDADSLDAQGIELVEWGPSVGRNKVEVQLAEYSEAVAESLYDTYGGDLIYVVPESMERPEEAAGRNYDVPPFYGGLALESKRYEGETTADCTSGANVRGPKGAEYIITAGHCWREGKTVYNGPNVLGKVVRRAYAQGGEVDAELIRESAGNRVWDNWPTQPDGAHTSVVIGRRHGLEPRGLQVCFDGANSRQACSVEIARTQVCVTFRSGHRTCGLVRTEPRFPTPVTGGDSGGPVYRGTDATHVRIYGMIVGRGADGVGYYQRMANVLRRYDNFALIR